MSPASVAYPAANSLPQCCHRFRAGTAVCRLSSGGAGMAGGVLSGLLATGWPEWAAATRAQRSEHLRLTSTIRGNAVLPSGRCQTAVIGRTETVEMNEPLWGTRNGSFGLGRNVLDELVPLGKAAGIMWTV
jgi:hypothetical protein